MLNIETLKPLSFSNGDVPVDMIRVVITGGHVTHKAPEAWKNKPDTVLVFPGASEGTNTAYGLSADDIEVVPDRQNRLAKSFKLTNIRL